MLVGRYGVVDRREGGKRRQDTEGVCGNPNDTGTKCSVVGGRAKWCCKSDATNQGMRELWRPEEDQLLKATVAAHGAQNWQDIAEIVNHYVSGKYKKWRSPKSCRQRWNEHLDPKLRLDPLNEDEKQKIVELQQKFGNQWTTIAQELGNRSPNTVKNFWYNHHRKARGLDPSTSQSNSEGKSTDVGSSDRGNSVAEQQSVSPTNDEQRREHMETYVAENYRRVSSMVTGNPQLYVWSSFPHTLVQESVNPVSMGFYAGTERGTVRLHTERPGPSPLGAHHRQNCTPNNMYHSSASRNAGHGYQHDASEEETMELFGQSAVPQNPYIPR